jgi:uncharacterized LabA/DUF88 family protein
MPANVSVKSSVKSPRAAAGTGLHRYASSVLNKGDLYKKANDFSSKERDMSPVENKDDDDPKPVNRVAVFLDGSNFFFMQKDALHWFIDPKKLLGWIGKNYGEITDANYYTTVDNRNEGQLMYLKALNHMGFRVETKPIDEYEDDEEGFDGSVDLDMLIDILVQMDNFDTAIIISGDADFARIVEILRSRGKKYLVLSTKGMVAGAIRRVAGMHYKDISELRDYIEKD